MPAANTPPTPDRTPTLVATAASAAAQATAEGKELHRLTVWNGLLYAAYGDYGTNTGPIDVISLDLADTGAGFTSEATLHTEETWPLRQFAGSLYVPHIDPQGYGDGTQGQYAVASTPGSWTVVSNVTPVPIHVFDVAVTADGIFLFGAANEPDPPNGGATVWRSTDNGATWTVSLAPRPDTTNIARFYGATVHGDEIIARVSSAAGSTTWLWSAGAWTEVTDEGHTVADSVPFVYQGTDFHLCLNFGKPEGSVANSGIYVRTAPADNSERAAIAASLPAGQFRDACTDGTHLWLLDSNGTVFKGATDGTWVTLCTLSLIPSSIAVSGSTLYLGTTDSKVYSTPA